MKGFRYPHSANVTAVYFYKNVGIKGNSNLSIFLAFVDREYPSSLQSLYFFYYFG